MLNFFYNVARVYVCSCSLTDSLILTIKLRLVQITNLDAKRANGMAHLLKRCKGLKKHGFQGLSVNNLGPFLDYGPPV